MPTKKCPFCAEEIQEEAIKCKHCGEFLNGQRPSIQAGPWYLKDGFIIFLFLCVGPFALPLVWFNPRYKPAVKIVITIVALIVTWLLGQMLMWAMNTMKQSYDMLLG